MSKPSAKCAAGHFLTRLTSPPVSLPPSLCSSPTSGPLLDAASLILPQDLCSPFPVPEWSSPRSSHGRLLLILNQTGHLWPPFLNLASATPTWSLFSLFLFNFLPNRFHPGKLPCLFMLNYRLRPPLEGELTQLGDLSSDTWLSLL